ncbi:hypothetical protein ACLQ3K_24565 [Tsukamurella sp. DT100]|uniref:hypothetical protein n=1 Tax=Tsukamurella sp. DT100 TaxID=3393415 RepID=UPI003CF8C4C2
MPEVTDWLREQIASGAWQPDTPGPTLDELNEKFFGVDAGPAKARNAYKPLVNAGIVKTVTGFHGGHYLVPSQEPTAAVNLSPQLDGVDKAVAELRDVELFQCEFQRVKDRVYFGASLHASRLAAEDFAIAILTELGVQEGMARTAAAHAAFTGAEAGVYAVRIYSVSLTGDVRETLGRARP